MIKKIIIILAAALLSFSASADDFSKAGTAGAQFLKIGVGARYDAMGEASVALVDDAYAMYWNPAGMTKVYANELAFTHTNYLLDVSLNYIAYVRRIDDLGVFGASATVLSMNEQEITTVDEPDGTGDTYGASSWAFQIGYARDLTAQFSIGLAVKFLGEKIYNESAQGFAFDFGTMLYTGINSLRIGMNISNMGPEMEFDGPDLDVQYEPDPTNPNQDPVNSRLAVDTYDLPLSFRVGIAYDFIFNPEAKLLLAAEAKHPNDNLQQGALGAEFAWRDKYFLRSGYKLNYEEEGFSFGGGLITRLSGDTDVSFDYAWVDYGRLSSIHRFSASLIF